MMHEAADNLETVAPEAALPGEDGGRAEQLEEVKKAQVGQSKVLQGLTAEGEDSDPCRPLPWLCLLQEGKWVQNASSLTDHGPMRQEASLAVTCSHSVLVSSVEE